MTDKKPDNHTFHIIKGVKAYYPKIDKPYRFDSSAGAKGKSVPCAATDDGAKYELQFVLTSEQAKELYKVMNNEYKTSDQRTDSWAAKLDQPFKEQEDGTFLGKASIKAAYNSAPTSPPTQFDSQNTRLPEGFQLTTGSTNSIAVVLVPYEINGTGVSLRLKSVQILALVPMVAASPFDTSDGYVGEEGFPTAPPAVTNGAATGDDADELFAEPKVKAPKAEIIPATPDAKEVTNLLDKWDDE